MKKTRYLHFCLILGFLLGIHKGYIALWQNGKETPLTVFPYQAHMLPVRDQLELAKGIPISNEVQLQQMLEDYLS